MLPPVLYLLFVFVPIHANLACTAVYVSPRFRLFVQLLVDVFLLPLQRWAKDLEAQRNAVLDHAAVHGGSIQARSARDFTQAGTVQQYSSSQ